ncbi:MAG TPA: ferritin-like domain-containing protein, partial [Gaiellales bacterium]|nr:ferritin-like domain-containing protein [Gaiellales bacterium]
VAEALAVTTYYRAITADEVFDQVPRGNRPYFRAALSEEYDHLVILQKAGAAATPTTFHYPTGTFESLRGFGKVLEALENAFISAYGAAVPRFCALGQPALAQLAYRIGGVEAEHRFAIRDTLGDTVPNNLCLEPALFDCVSDAAAALAPFVNGASGFTETRRMPTANQITNAIGPFGCS